MPMFYTSRAYDYVARPDFLHWFAPLLRSANARGYYQHLSHRMNMPVGTGTRLKGYASSTGTHFIIGWIKPINSDISCKMPGWAFS